ncbi:MAG TPA: TIGR01777 family oxidoreductase [Candidatus Binatia bacterium]|nr:TIGR01777 family oxidoreductase [Candidatus Binatia bacterium]
MKRTKIEGGAPEVYQWLCRPGAFERLVPPWESVRTIGRFGRAPEAGSRTEFEIRVGPFSRRWLAEHTACEPGRMFRDEQIAGPFARWSHTHTLEPAGGNACVLEDRVEYELPLGVLGTLAAGSMRRRMERGFAYRHRVTSDDVTAHRRWSAAPQRILVTGATGLLGGALVPYLAAGGHTVVRLARSAPTTQPWPGMQVETIVWDPASGSPAPPALEGFDAVVHLAGESIAAGRWTEGKKQRIRASRVRGSKALSEALARLIRRPRVLVAVSAIGYYGDRGDENLVESSPRGQGFLAEVCEEWEAAAGAARAAGIRVVQPRIGVVLSPAGGALGKMLPPFRMGAGGIFGSGKQWMSWIALDDVLDILLRAVADRGLTGPVNAVAPHPVTNAEWTEALGRLLHRPTQIPMPPFVARAVFGEMADELLLSSTRVLPERLLAGRHTFRFLEAEAALRYLLGK